MTFGELKVGDEFRMDGGLYLKIGRFEAFNLKEKCTRYLNPGKKVT